MSDTQKTREEHERRLAELLRDIDFSERYYAYCDAHPLQQSAFALSGEAQRRLIACTGLGFEYNPRERFFAHVDESEPQRVQLNVIFEARHLELVLSFRTGAGGIGGPYHVLARAVERLVHGPDVKRDPRYPRMRFFSDEEAAQAFALGLELYRDARAKILGERWG